MASAQKQRLPAVIAAGHAATAAAAAEVLRAGGNAFDAAVAAGFASAVAEPMLTSLGGGGFLLARTAVGREVLFDFFVDTPGQGLSDSSLEPHFFPVTVHFGGSDQDFNIGLGSVAVPGNLKGYLHVHRQLGRLALTDVLAPAIRLARDGLLLTARIAYMVDILAPILTLTEAGRALYAPGRRPLREGEWFFNPDLAQFLEALPDNGGESLYAGDLARRVAQDMEAGGGLVTAADLGAYQVTERAPLAVGYRGRKVLTNPPPSVGGSLIALSLALLERQDLGSVSWNSAEHLRILVTIMEEVERLRAGGCEAADIIAAGKDVGRSGRRRRSTRGTTHVSVADAEGNVASMTTSNGEGSGYIVPRTGIMLNNMLGEDDLHPDGFHASPPGMRVASMMAPSLVLQDGAISLVVGSGGSKRIRTALLQVVSHVVDFGVPVGTAVETPRLHWDGEQVQVEPGFPDSAVKALRRRWPINVWAERNMYFGGVNAVSPVGEVGADSRRGGGTATLQTA